CSTPGRPRGFFVSCACRRVRSIVDAKHCSTVVPMTSSFHLSQRALQTGEPPISYFMEQAVQNPNLISLAAGLVEAESLPADEVRAVVNAILGDPCAARAALQYGTTQGHLPLREKILTNALKLDGLSARDTKLSPDDVVVTTGSQQLLYLLGELLFDQGDI